MKIQYVVTTKKRAHDEWEFYSYRQLEREYVVELSVTVTSQRYKSTQVISCDK